MKTRLRVYAWVMVLLLVAGVCAPLLMYQFSRKPLTVSSVVTLKYDVVRKSPEGKIIYSQLVEDLTAPDGEELDLNQVTSSYVLQSALDGMTLSQPLTLTDLRDNVRIDRILTEDSRRQQEIASKMLDTLAERLKAMDISITFTDAAVTAIADKGFDDNYGARPLRRAIQSEIEDSLSEQMLDGKVQSGSKVVCDIKDGKFTFETE